MRSMPIYLNTLTYIVKPYGKRKGQTVLLEERRHTTRTSREVCIGNTLELVNDKMYNSYILGKLQRENKKTQGCEIEIIEVQPISQCGYTTKRFEDEE
mgnify:CR=1 FL=1